MSVRPNLLDNEITPEEKIRKDAYYFLVSIAIFVWFHLLYNMYIIAFPIVNTVWQNENPYFIPVDYRHTFIWYMVWLPLFIGWLPLILLMVIARPNSMIRADLHMVASYFSMLLAGLGFIGTFAVYWTFCNSQMSGASSACNRWDWCCAFNQVPGNENECPSQVPCNPLKTRDDLGYSNDEWKQLIWLYLFQVVWSFIHWLINKVIRYTGLASTHGKRESKMVAILFFLGCLVYFFYFVGIAIVNLQFICGYPLLEGGVELGQYFCRLYSLDYWAVWFLFLNALPIIAFIVALLFNTTVITPTIHLACSWIASITTMVVFVYFIAIILLQTNDYIFWSSLSVTNHEQYCSAYFDRHPDICPNFMPIPNQVSLFLNPNSAFVKVFFITIGFIGINIVQLFLNGRMKRYGLFYSIDGQI